MARLWHRNPGRENYQVTSNQPGGWSLKSERTIDVTNPGTFEGTARTSVGLSQKSEWKGGNLCYK